MRENERRIGGTQRGLFSMFSIFEPAEPRTSRTIDQSIVAWRLASINHGTAVFENPRSVIQRTVGMITGGSNAANLRRDMLQPLASAAEPTYCPYFFCQPPDSERVILIIHRRLTAGEVRARMVSEREANRRSGYLSEIQRRFHSPELQEAMNHTVRGYREAIQAAQNAD